VQFSISLKNTDPKQGPIIRVEFLHWSTFIYNLSWFSYRCCPIKYTCM